MSTATREAGCWRRRTSRSSRPAASRTCRTTRAWYDVHALPATAFDHHFFIEAAVDRLRGKLSYTNIGFALAPEEFTIAALRDIVAAALGHPVDPTNLHRVMTRRHMIEPTGARAPSGAAGGRPAALFRFRARSLSITDPFAVLKPPAGGGRLPADLSVVRLLTFT